MVSQPSLSRASVTTIDHAELSSRRRAVRRVLLGVRARGEAQVGLPVSLQRLSGADTVALDCSEGPTPPAPVLAPARRGPLAAAVENSACKWRLRLRLRLR